MGRFVQLLTRWFGGCFGIENHRRRRSARVCPDVEAEALEKKKQIGRQLGRDDLAGIETNHYEDVILNEAVLNLADISVECDSRIPDVKKQFLFDTYIVPLQRPELFAHGSKLVGGPRQRVNFDGPPLSTKVYAKFIARESGAVFIHAKKMVNLMMTNRYDAAEKLQHIVAMFSLAFKLQPAVIFISDEEDFSLQLSLCNMKTEFTDIMNLYFTDKKLELAQVMLIGTSECASPKSDEAMMRHVPAMIFDILVPHKKERAELLKSVILKNERVEDNIDYEHLAAVTEGLKVPELFGVCKKAAYSTIRDHLTDEEKTGKKQSCPPRPMSQMDIENVVNKLSHKPSSLGFKCNGEDRSNNVMDKNVNSGIQRMDSVVRQQTPRRKWRWMKKF